MLLFESLLYGPPASCLRGHSREICQQQPGHQAANHTFSEQPARNGGEWTDRQRDGLTSSESIFPKSLGTDKVQTSKSMASGGNCCRNIFSVNLGVLPSLVLVCSSTVNVSQETEISSTVRAQCSSIFHLPLCAFYGEVRSVRVNI